MTERRRGTGECGPTGSAGATGIQDLGALMGMKPLKDMQSANGRLWHLTPWWVFWRPTWRKRIIATGDARLFTDAKWIYQTNKQRAAEVLKEKFGD